MAIENDLTKEQQRCFSIRLQYETYSAEKGRLLEAEKKAANGGSVEQSLVDHHKKQTELSLQSLRQKIEWFESLAEKEKQRCFAAEDFYLPGILYWGENENREYDWEYLFALSALCEAAENEGEFVDKWHEMNTICSASEPQRHPLVRPQPFPAS